MTIKILLADDHNLIREGLRSLIGKDPSLEVISEACNGRMAIKLVEKLMPDIIIMDISMPDMNGIEATRKALAIKPNIKIIALTMHADARFVLGMMEAGAKGYLLKDCIFDELILAIGQVAAGHTYLSPQIADVVVKGYLNRSSPDTRHAGQTLLTAREREILQLIAEGLTAKEIAVHVFVSIKTIETHRRNIMQKLNMYSVVELTKYALREGIVTLGE